MPTFLLNILGWFNFIEIMLGRTIFLYFSLQLSFVIPHSIDLGELIFVNILFRHGDRTPIEPYPNDPYNNNSLWPVPWGELTDNGKRGHYELGKWLRDRYGHLLNAKYNKNDIHIRSTDVDRTLMSAYSNLAGLYEPDPKSNWNPDIRWTPIPVHTTPETLDPVLAGKAPCLKYDNEFKRVLNSKEFMKLNEKFKKLYLFLSEATGKNVSSVIDIENIYDTLFIEQLNNFTLPNWTKEVYPEPMKTLAAISFEIPCYSRTMARLKIGLFFKEILDHMEKKVSDTNFKPKAFMYSAHDTTVANVLKALHLFEPHCPPYLSLILLELRKKNNDYFIAIHYRNSSTVPPYLLQLKGCEKLCPLQTFKEIISPLIPQDWESECRGIRFAQNIYDTTASISFITTIFLALLFLLSLIVVLKFYKKQRWNQSDIAYKSLKMEITS